MACCYIAAFCIGQLVKVCQFLDFDDQIRYNEDVASPIVSSDDVNNDNRTISAADRTEALVLSLSGLTCSGCVGNVERALTSLPDVDQARVSLPLQQATVIGKERPLDQELILRTVREAGYDAEVGPRSPRELAELLQSKQEIDRLRSSLSHVMQYTAMIQLAASTASVFTSRSSSIWSLAGFLQFLATALAVACQYWHVSWIHLDSWRLLRRGKTNMNTLISISTGLGLCFSLLDVLIQGPGEATTYHTTTIGLTLVVVAGRYLDALSRRQASKDLIRLYSPLLNADYVTLHPTKQRVPNTFLRPSDQIVIDPYTMIPCDCYVISGSSLVNQSIVTGESIPVAKGVGDFLLGGTRNMHGSLVCVVHKEKGQSFYSQLVESVSESTSAKLSGYEFIDVTVRYFVTGVLLLAVIIPAVGVSKSSTSSPSLYKCLTASIDRAMAILTSACPCALGLATPSAVVAAVNAAQRKGVLLTKGVSTIEKLERVDLIIFDKTGTLTEGSLDVETCVLETDWIDKKNIFWTLVCAVEESGAPGHPAGRAIFRRGIQELGSAWSQYKTCGTTRSINNTPGRGVVGDVKLGSASWNHVCTGSLQHLKHCGVTGLPNELEMHKDATVAVHVGVDGRYAGSLCLRDRIKAETKDTIRKLKYAGYECQMLTGDLPEEAKRVAAMVEMPVLASQVMPMKKLEFIKSAQEDGKVVAMIGDGLNDAPSLAAADVGIMISHDTAAATIGGSVIILNSQIDRLPVVFAIAKQAMRQIRFNLLWALVYNVIALSLAAGRLKVFGMMVTPSLGAALMSASSIAMTVQGLRLRARLETLEI